ncbi:MAG: hypothetical protein K6G03_03485 [Lachnospiraceae bacterium]|nr:hypothetical protein [Lachnospiraceae bacterium]
MKILNLFAEYILMCFPPKEAEAVREKQILIHPGGSGSKLTKEYYIKKLSLVLLVISIGSLLSVLILIYDLTRPEELTGNVIERNSYGQGNRTVRLNIYADGELIKKERTFNIEERSYSDEEIRSAFLETAKELDQTVLGENKSFDHIDHDLVLPDSSTMYPIEIEWMTGDHDVLDMSGHIQDDFQDNKGRDIKLTAVMSYGEQEAEHTLYAKVYPKYRTSEEILSYELESQISEKDKISASENKQRLPDTVAGHTLRYEYSLSKTWLYVFGISVLAALIIYIGKDHDLTKEVVKREREMLLDYPEIVSKLTLLIGAGMTTRGAFEKIVTDYKVHTGSKRSFAREEMLVTLYRMKSGVSETEAYLDFGKRCAIRRYVKLGALLAQNIKKGSAGLLPELEREIREAFEERKAEARKSGEIASTKLLFPMILMLGVVMFIIIVPAFMSFSL